MKYAKEVIDLMGAYPGRDWKMAEIVRYVSGGNQNERRQRDAIRQGVLRVIQSLQDTGTVLCRPSRPGVRNTAVYRWEKCDMNTVACATGSATIAVAELYLSET